MFKRIVVKSVAGAAGAGVVLALAGLTSPAAVSASPAIKNMACSTNYPNPAASNTALAVVHYIHEYGKGNRAVATVASGGKNASGSVRFATDGHSWLVPLVDGRAAHALPTRMGAAETYKVRARYLPDCKNGEVAGSRDHRFVTVNRANTEITSRFASDIKRGGHPVIEAVVASRTLSPGGRAKVILANGNARKTKVVAVDRIGHGDSKIHARFGRTFKRGQWTVTVRYLGTHNFEPCREFAGFKVG
jgi:hypothetical protein